MKIDRKSFIFVLRLENRSFRLPRDQDWGKFYIEQLDFFFLSTPFEKEKNHKREKENDISSRLCNLIPIICPPVE